MIGAPLLVEPWVVVACGLAIGLSLTFLVVSLPVFRRPSLADRLAPYVRSTRPGRMRDLRHVPENTGVLGMLTSWWYATGSWVAGRMTTHASIEHRVGKLGRGASVERFRAHQVLAILVGLALGLVLAAAVTTQRGFHPVLALGCLLLGALGGHMFNDWLLSARVQRRERRILAEFPTTAELLALSITAGEGIVDALERVRRSTSGELSEELEIALARTRTGTPLIEALDDFGARIGNPQIIQFVDGIAVALSRGTPLAEVLRAQAKDVRELGRRSLMELSGKKEVAMLVPVVLFVLPVTVLFAVFPSLSVLELSF